MEALKALALWLAPMIVAAMLWRFWGWLVLRICGKPRPEIVAILMFLSIAIPAMIFVIMFNLERNASQ